MSLTKNWFAPLEICEKKTHKYLTKCQLRQKTVEKFKFWKLQTGQYTKFLEESGVPPATVSWSYTFKGLGHKILDLYPKKLSKF